MAFSQEKQTILVAEDDSEDRLFIARALKACGWCGEVIFTSDGEQLMSYLRQERQVENAKSYPNLILIDLRMPKKNGYEVLEEVKSDLNLQRIPVVVLTTSKNEADIQSCYVLGASSYIIKPNQFSVWTETMGGLIKYWLGLVQLPNLTYEN